MIQHGQNSITSSHIIKFDHFKLKRYQCIHFELISLELNVFNCTGIHYISGMGSVQG
uniref:Uncharacterized protein n=1 Tax=Anguilla anguilla TaxID=7936 RepID=A0A0E9WD40_ANGAN